MGTAEAATRSWIGASSALVSDGGNWQGGIAPGPGDRLVFGGGATFTNISFNVPGASYEAIDFLGNQTYTLNGFGITLTGDVPITVNSYDTTFFIYNDLRLAAPSPQIQVMRQAAPFGVYTYLNIYGNRLVIASGALRIQAIWSMVSISASIQEESLAALFLEGDGGRVILSGSNTFSGGLVSSLNELITLSPNALGSPTAVVNITRGMLVFNSPAVAEAVVPHAISLPNSYPPGANGVFLNFSPTRFTGTIFIGSDARFSSALGATFDGPIFGPGRLVIDNPTQAVTTLNSNGNSFTGGVQVERGRLRLGTSEAIPDNNVVRLASAQAEFEVGAATETIAGFDCGTGLLSMIPGAGQLRVAGPSVLSGCRLELSTIPSLPPGAVTLIRGGGGPTAIGQFSNYVEGARIAFPSGTRVITYQGGPLGRDVTLLPPEEYAQDFEVVSGAPQSFAVNTASSQRIAVRALNAARTAVPGARIQFELRSRTASCFFDNGMVFPNIANITADAGGIATSPVLRSGTDAGTCEVVVSGPSYQSIFELFVFDPASLTITAFPSAVLTRATTNFAFEVGVSGPGGVTYPGVEVLFEVEAGGTAGASVLSPSARTDVMALRRARVTGTGDSRAGSYFIVARVGSASARIPVTQVAATAPLPASVTGVAPNGGTINLSRFSSFNQCGFVSSQFIDLRAAIFPPDRVPPASLALPFGLIDFRVENCGAGQPVTFVIEFPRPLPPTATYWKFGPTPDNRTPHWYSMPGTIDGNRFSFTIVDGGLGDDDLIANGSIADMGGLAFHGGTLQDLWWSGTAENGWGMSIIQHRDVLVANIYVYDDSGRPMWLIMSGGTWNAARTAFTGALYIPHGSPYYAYDVSRFNVGAPVGTATFTFSGENNALFEYSINGVTGRKDITRLAFGRPEMVSVPTVGDLWWGGIAQNGWGITVLQQVRTLFSLWFTYDASGAPTWYVMPGGDWTSSDTYEGRIYRAVGPKWIGAPYDATQHRTIEVGNYRLRFTGETASFEYTVDGRSGSEPLTRLGF